MKVLVVGFESHTVEYNVWGKRDPEPVVVEVEAEVQMRGRPGKGAVWVRLTSQEREAYDALCRSSEARTAAELQAAPQEGEQNAG
jgi:hypothetical protein